MGVSSYRNKKQAQVKQCVRVGWNTYKLNQIDDWCLGALLLLELSELLGSDKGPKFVQVDFGPEFVLAAQMEVPHTDLTEVTRMVFVEVDAVMVHTTSVTATSGMLAVLADTTMTVADVTTQLPGLLPLDIRLNRNRNQQLVKETHKENSLHVQTIFKCGCCR